MCNRDRGRRKEDKEGKQEEGGGRRGSEPPLLLTLDIPLLVHLIHFLFLFIFLLLLILLRRGAASSPIEAVFGRSGPRSGVPLWPLGAILGPLGTIRGALAQSSGRLDRLGDLSGNIKVLSEALFVFVLFVFFSWRRFTDGWSPRPCRLRNIARANAEGGGTEQDTLNQGQMREAAGHPDHAVCAMYRGQLQKEEDLNKTH